MSLKSTGLLAAVLVAAALPASADTFSAYTTPSTLGGGCTGVFGGAGSSAPISSFVSCGGVGYSSTASAASTPGAVHAAAQAFG